MLRAVVRRDAAGRIREIKVAGHAGFAEYGTDIVCAAVSALAQTAPLGLERVGARFTHSQRPGELRLALPEQADGRAEERAQDVLEAIVAGLAAIAAEYGDHFRLEDRAGGTGAGRGPQPAARRGKGEDHAPV
ncbi:MAG: ribosomal-processing cysteine protease Prp [Firmicutes bacterium]|nr:ribosomal-processing cysteine protease Prp [Bacillota bacterium]